MRKIFAHNKWTMLLTVALHLCILSLVGKRHRQTGEKTLARAASKSCSCAASPKKVILHSLIKCVIMSAVKREVVTCNLLPAGNLFENL